MIRSYLTIAFRHLFTEKLYSAINIAGLAIGLTCFILIGLFVQHELSYDRHYAKADRIYRVSRDFFPGGESSLELELAGIAPQAAPLLKQDFPEIEHGARMFRGNVLISRDDVAAYELDYWVDGELLQMFDFEWLRGDPSTALVEPFSIVLTESLSRKYFGSGDPIGQTLMIGDHGRAKVTGVIRDLPDNTHLRFDLLGSLSTMAAVSGPEFLENWTQNSFHTYLLLEPGADVAEIQRRSGEFLERHFAHGASAFTGVTAMALTDIHLRSNREGEMATPGSTTTVYAFSAIAAFILLIACINFMNLATAHSAQRAKEVGIRKAIGAERRNVVTQFLGESLLLVAIAVTLAAAFIELALPAFSAFMQAQLTFDYKDPGVLLALAALTLLVGLIAGSYPAFYLSAFQPAPVLKGDVTRGRAAATFRKALVVSQFAISIALLSATATVYLQIRFVNAVELGYEKEQVVVLSGAPSVGVGEQWAALKQALLSHPEITDVTASSLTPAGPPNARATSVRFEGGNPEGQRGVPFVLVDYGFFETYRIEPLAGRTFSDTFGTDQLMPPSEQNPQSTAAYVLSVRAARQFGWSPEEAIGKWFEMSLGNRFAMSARGPVIGVVADVHFESVRTALEPTVYLVPPLRIFGQPALHHASVRITGRNVRETLDYLDGTWTEFMPEQPVNRHFVDQDYAALYQNEQRQAQTFASFTLLAILVGCLGLFGLASYMTERRTKEIGIRKVMGGTIGDIVLLLTAESGKLVLLANVIAWPVTYFLMQRWLAGFAYRIDMNPLIFVGSGMVALAIASLTVSAVAARAAVVKPLNSLRSE